MGKKVLVIGELNVDIIVSGLSAFPSLGREILAGGLQIVMGSSSAICAAGLARLGSEVDFLGKVGADYYGDFATEQLSTLGVGVDGVIRDDAARTGVTISLTYPADRALITYPGCISELRLEDIETSVLLCYNHLHVGSYFLQRALQPGLPELLVQARGAGLTTSLDTGHDPEEKWGDDALRMLLDLVDIFLPNKEEARAIARADATDAALRELARHARLVAVKCGLSGAMTMHDGRMVHSPAFEVEVKDTTGAGDSFNAGFIYAHVIRGLSPEEALRFGNACAALSATGFGGTAAQPTLEQVLAFLETQSR